MSENYCKVCGKKISPKAKYCRKHCYNEEWRKRNGKVHTKKETHKFCSVCGKRIDSRASYCKKHYIKHSNWKNNMGRAKQNNKNRAGKKHSKATKEKIRKAHLGKKLTKKHREKVIKTLNHKKGARSANWKDGISYKKYYCKNCGKKISVKSGAYGNSLCLSCSLLGHKGLKGNKSPNWNGGTSFLPYPPVFDKELKEKIRARDNYICQGCGMSEEEHIVVYGEKLNVHHINYKKKDCSENNLITVCRQCNIRANYNRKYWKKYYLSRVDDMHKLKIKRKG